jgi:hypothetical protein
VSVTITTPGVYDLPAEVYHADPVPGGSLSHTGARLLVSPGCPAKFAHWRANPPPPKRDFDLGHAAHRVILGAGQDLAIIDADNYLTKAAKEGKRTAYEAGRIPVLTREHEQVLAMAAAVREHPVAGPLFDPASGRPEQSLFWVDRPCGVWRRARLDWLPHPGPSRIIIPDYKTAACGDPERFSRPLADHGYHMQAAWYVDGVRALGLADRPAYVLVVQEKSAPYLVTLLEPDPAALRIGRLRNREAIECYQRCTLAGHWPGYSDDVERVSLPRWVESEYGEET